MKCGPNLPTSKANHGQNNWYFELKIFCEECLQVFHSVQLNKYSIQFIRTTWWSHVSKKHRSENPRKVNFRIWQKSEKWTILFLFSVVVYYEKNHSLSLWTFSQVIRQICQRQLWTSKKTIHSNCSSRHADNKNAILTTQPNLFTQRTKWPFWNFSFFALNGALECSFDDTTQKLSIISFSSFVTSVLLFHSSNFRCCLSTSHLTYVL